MAVIPGCTDNTACNYNASANVDDGSCKLPGIYGCDEYVEGYPFVKYDGNFVINSGKKLRKVCEQIGGSQGDCVAVMSWNLLHDIYPIDDDNEVPPELTLAYACDWTIDTDEPNIQNYDYVWVACTYPIEDEPDPGWICDGQWIDPAEEDDCGVCSGGNTGHIANSDKDCADVCFGDSWVSDCGCVAVDNSGDDCDDCAGTPYGLVVVDACGNCDGDCFDSNGFITCNPNDINNNIISDCLGNCCGGGSYGVCAQPAENNGCCLETDLITYCQDTDGDNLGNPGTETLYCLYQQPVGWVQNCGDQEPDCFDNYYDCNLECGGTAEEDACGVCEGSAVTGVFPSEGHDNPGDPGFDCFGTCSGTAFIDECGVCSGGQSEHEANSDNQGCGCFEPAPSGCDNTCGSTLVNDECGVCNGDGIVEGTCDCAGTLPSGCDNTCGSTLVNDECGVCDGPGEDDCGVCEPVVWNSSCTGCTDTSACTYSDNNIFSDSTQCFYFDCNGVCACEENDFTDITCPTIEDTCGECGGDNDCYGCMDSEAANWDETATQEGDCLYGDLTIYPSDNAGFGQPEFVFESVGINTDTAEGNPINPEKGWQTSCENADGSSGTIVRYTLIIDKKNYNWQNYPLWGMTIKQTACAEWLTEDDLVADSTFSDFLFYSPAYERAEINRCSDGQSIGGTTYSPKTLRESASVGTDGIGPGEPGYTGPDDDGSEGLTEEDRCIARGGDWGPYIICDNSELIYQTEGFNDVGKGGSGICTADGSNTGMESVEAFVECGYQRVFNINDIFLVTLEVEDSCGNITMIDYDFEVEGAMELEQTIVNDHQAMNNQHVPYAPYQGMNIPFNAMEGCVDGSNIAAGTLVDGVCADGTTSYPYENTEQWFDVWDVDPRPTLGCFYFKDMVNQMTGNWVNNRLSWPIISKNYNSIVETGCHVYKSGDMISGDPQDSGNCYTVKDAFPEVGNFHPDADVRTHRAFIGNQAKLYKYYDKNIEPDLYYETTAPSEVQVHFYPREYVQGDTIFDEHDILDWGTDDRAEHLYVGFLDWGDGSPVEFDFEPKKLEVSTLIPHFYEKPGIYEITAIMFNMQLGTNSTGDSAYNPNGPNDRSGVANWNVVKVRINLSEPDDYENSFIEYEETLPIIGGLTEHSIYYKSIYSQLRTTLQQGTGGSELFDIHFDYAYDKYSSEYALAQFNEDILPPSIAAFKDPVYDGYVNDDGSSAYNWDDPSSGTTQIPPTLIHNGLYRDFIEEFGQYFGDYDLGQARYFKGGNISMNQLLGFDTLQDSYELLEGEGAVLLTAPHGPITLRPTVGTGNIHDHDDYTNAMVHKLHELTNVHVLYNKYKCDDPNYYHHIGTDFVNRSKDTETPGFYGIEGQLHPFKKRLKNYLEEHPEIRLVLDIHGAGSHREFAVDIGMGWPEKNRDPEGDYFTDDGISPNHKHIWVGQSDEECREAGNCWDVFDDLDTYAPTLHSNFAKGIPSTDTADPNPTGEFLLEKIVDIFHENDIGAGDIAYHDRPHTGGHYDGEYFGQEPHGCPGGQDYAGGYWSIHGYDYTAYLNGSYSCDTPGIKKPVTFGRDFTGGRQNTVLRYVGLDAQHIENLADQDGTPASFIGNIDVLQFEFSRNHRTFENDEPIDTRTIKSLVEMIDYTNTFYGYNIHEPIDWGTSSEDIYIGINNLWQDYLKPLGTTLYDFNALNDEIDPGNPGSPRYWKNIIPEDYTISDREGVELDSIDEDSSQEWLGENEYYNTYYYPVLPKLNVFGEFDETLGLQNSNEPFGLSGRKWDGEDVTAPVTNVNFSNNKYKYDDKMLIDLSFDDIDDNKLSEYSGNGIVGDILGDYRIDFEPETRRVSPSSIVTRPKLGKGKRRAY